MANNILQFGASVDLGALNAGFDQARANVVGATENMSDAFKALSLESEEATSQVNSAFLQSAGAARDFAKAKDEVRIASRAAKQAEDDDTAALANLALAQQKAAAAATQQVTAQKAIEKALQEEKEVAEQVAIANMSLFERMQLSFRETAEVFQEQAAEISASLAETAESATLAGGAMGLVTSAFGKLLGVGIAAGIFTHLISESAEASVELGHLSEKTGISVGVLKELRLAAAESGSDFEAISTGLIRMLRSENEARGGSEKLVAQFKAMGISAQELKALETPEQLLVRLGKAFDGSRGAAVEADAAIAIWGKGGAALIPIMHEMGASLDALVEKGEANNDTVKRQVEAAQEWTRVSAEIAAELKGDLAQALVYIVPIIKGLIIAFDELYRIAATVFEGIAGAVHVALIAIGTTFSSIFTALTGAANVAARVITGNWSAIPAEAHKAATAFSNSWREGWNETKITSSATIAAISDEWKAFRKDNENLFSEHPHSEDKPDLGDNEPKEKKQKPEKDDRLQEWREQLEKMRDAEDGFHTLSKQAEADYWASKLAIAFSNAKLFAEVYHLQREAERAVQKQSFDEEVQQVEDKVKAEKSGSAQRVVILEEFLDHAKKIGADQTEQYKRLQAELITATRENVEAQDRLTIANEETKVEATRKGSLERIQAEQNVLAVMQRLGLQETTEYQAQLRKMADSTREFAEERKRVAEIAAETERSTEQYNFDLQKQNIQFLAQAGIISHQEELRQLRTFEEQKYQIEYQAMIRRIQLASLDPTQSPAQMAKLGQELLRIEQQNNLKLEQIDKQALQLRLQEWQNFSRQVTTDLFNGVNQWIQGQKTFAQAMKEVWNNIVLDIIKDIEQIAAKWIQEHIIMAAVSKLLGIDDTGSQQVAKNTAIASSNEALAQSNTSVAATQVLSDAIQDYGLEGIPIGIGLADAVKAEGDTLSAPIFEFGGLVPGFGATPSVLHGQEMVLPRVLSQRVQNWTDPHTTNNNSQGGNTTHIHSSPTVHVHSEVDGKKMLSEHADHIGRIVKSQSGAFNR